MDHNPDDIRWLVRFDCGHTIAVHAPTEELAGNVPDGKGGVMIRVCEEPTCAPNPDGTGWWGPREVWEEQWPGEPARDRAFDWSPWYDNDDDEVWP